MTPSPAFLRCIQPVIDNAMITAMVILIVESIIRCKKVLNEQWRGNVDIENFVKVSRILDNRMLVLLFLMMAMTISIVIHVLCGLKNLAWAYATIGEIEPNLLIAGIREGALYDLTHLAFLGISMAFFMLLSIWRGKMMTNILRNINCKK